MGDSDDFDEFGCDLVLRGAKAVVVMAKGVTKEFAKLDTKQQARLLSNAKVWADGHPPTPEQFNGNEGRCGGDNDRMLVAVKVRKIRLYGFIRRLRKDKTLILVDIDPAKKQNKAVPRILKRAKKAVEDMDQICGEK